MAENIVHNPPIHLQANLTKAGDLIAGSRPMNNNMAKPKMCRVVSVDRIHGKVRVTNEQSKSSNKNSVQKPGGETVQLPVDYYGINTSGNIFGKFPYVGVGERVLVVHVNGDLGTPLVVAAYPDEGIEKHLTPTEPYEAQSNKDTYFDDFRAQKTVLPSQHVILHTGTGNYEHSLDGYSVIAQLNPGDYDNPPWYNDYYTGLPSATKHGIPMNCFVDKSNDNLYPIQNKQAQDWLKIHQSNTPNDHHITKRLVKQNGNTHNFWGSKKYKNNSLSEDASADNGYLLTNHSGKSDISNYSDRNKIVRFAKKQIGKHPYSTLSFNKFVSNPKKYKNQSLKDEILYSFNPKDNNQKSGSNKLNFIWYVLKSLGLDVPSKPWSNYQLMVLSFKKTKKGHKGDLVFLESDNYKKYIGKHLKHEIPDPGVYYVQPYILAENYHGFGTKIIGENKKAKNVVETTVDKVYNFKKFQHLAFFTIGNTCKTGTSIRLGQDNSIRLSIVSPKTVGYHKRNTFYLNDHYGSWRVMGHSITIDANGVKIDGRSVSARINKLKDKLSKLTQSIAELVYNLNDPHSTLTYKLASNYLSNLITKNTNWHDLNVLSSTPLSKIADIAKSYLKYRHIKPLDFIYKVIQKAGFKVPAKEWTFSTIKDTQYLTKIDVSTAKQGSIYIIDDDYYAQAGILAEDYHGQNTKIFESGGSQRGVHKTTFGKALNTADIDDISFYIPTKDKSVLNTLPQNNDILNIGSITQPHAVSDTKYDIPRITNEVDNTNYSNIYNNSSSSSNVSDTINQNAILKQQNTDLSNKYNHLVDTLKSRGILPSDYQ